MSTALAPLETAVGFLLLFFLPGYTLTRAVFPEWRLVPPDRLRRLLEVVTLSFVLSVVLTVLLGELLLNLAPSGFRAAWSDPELEVALAIVAGLAFAAGLLRGAYGREVRRAPGTPAPSEEGAWELTVELDRLGAEARRLSRRIRELPPESEAAAAARRRLGEVDRQREELGRRREEQYAE
jgi:hypothetical protein